MEFAVAGVQLDMPTLTADLKNELAQTARKLRVNVTAFRLARDIAKKIEESMQYPGQIKVTVIREMRAVDYAK